jgi:hypothetical protein
MNCLDDVFFVQKLKILDIALEDLGDIFEILDDGDGQIDQVEFCTGMVNMQGSAQGHQMMKATCLMRNQNLHFQTLEEAFVEDSLHTFGLVEGHVDSIQEGVEDLMYIVTEVMDRLNFLGIQKIVGASAHKMPNLLDPDRKTLKTMERDKMARAREIAEFDIEEEELPPESFMHTVVPPSWIIREKRSPLLDPKNRGKLKLIQNPHWKEKILSKKPDDARTKKKKQTIVGPGKDFEMQWKSLDIPLTDKLLLKGPELSNDEPLYDRVPTLACSLNGSLIGPVPIGRAASSPKADRVALSGIPSLKKAEVDVRPPHPHAVPDT